MLAVELDTPLDLGDGIAGKAKARRQVGLGHGDSGQGGIDEQGQDGMGVGGHCDLDLPRFLEALVDRDGLLHEALVLVEDGGLVLLCKVAPLVNRGPLAAPGPASRDRSRPG